MTLRRVKIAWLVVLLVAMACAAVVTVERQQCDEQTVRAVGSISSYTWACPGRHQ